MTASLFDCTDWKSFNRAFAARFEIQIYAAAALLCAAVAGWFATGFWQVALPALVIIVVYPAYEYVLHRWLLHNAHLCRTPVTAKAWWRLHYRHHSQPRDTDVILGAPWSLVGAVVLGAALFGWMFRDPASFAAGAATAFLLVIAYEYLHSFEHGKVPVRNRFLTRMRQHHLAHHFFNEQGNYGITTDIVDRVMRTRLKPDAEQGRSPTVYNLGYRGDLAARYPWVEAFDREVNRTRAGGDEARSEATQ